MRFIVRRTSDDFGDGKKSPCENATIFKMPYVQCVRKHTPEEYDKTMGIGYKWLDNGENHRINNEGFIERDMYRTVWGVEINNLEELLQFQDKCKNEIIISRNYLNKDFFEIEIYDDYRE